MREFYEGKSVRLTILMLFSVSLVGIAGGFAIYFDSLDRLAAENLKERVQVALRIEANQQNRFLEEYSFWDKAYEKTVLSPDEEWIERNSGKYLIDKLGLSFSLAVDDGIPSYIATDETSKEINYSILAESGLDSLMEKSRNSFSLFKIVSGYIIYEDELYLVSVGPFINEETKLPVNTDDFLVLGKRLDSAYLESIGEDFMISGLDFAGKPGDHESALPLDGESGMLGYIIWDEHIPSRELLPKLGFMIFLFYLLTLGGCWYILRREARNIKAEEEKLYFLATKDFLTGIYNRRHVMELGQRMLSTHARYGRSMSVLLLDIDHFKVVNDRYGHDTGDKILNMFSKIVLSKLRPSDILGRFGGEEFIVALHDTEYRQALVIADRIREAIQDLGVDSGGKLPEITVSIGVASNCDSTDFDEIIRNADDALYRAKHGGRNRVVSHECGC